MKRRTNQTKTTMYKRHADTCKLAGQPQNFNCQCPIWFHGKINGTFRRESLNSRSYGEAETILRGIENGDDRTPPDGTNGPKLVATPKGNETFASASATFLNTAKNRLAENTFAKYARTYGQFNAWLATQDITSLRAIESDHVRLFFEGMTNTRKTGKVATKRNTKQGQLDDLRTFFNWAKNEKRMIDDSPAASRKLNQNGTQAGGTSSQRKPFTPAQITLILSAVEQMPADERDTARALVYLMLYTGVRICDATWFERAWIKDVVVDGRAIKTADFVQIKTRNAIALPPKLQQVVLDALAKMPASRVYFFVADREDDYAAPRAALRDGREFKRGWKKAYDLQLRRTSKIIAKVLDLAGVVGTCHSFRDTFAINLLAANQNIAHVSQALGHSKIEMTMKHYMKLIPGYREQMSTITDALDYVFPTAA